MRIDSLSKAAFNDHASKASKTKENGKMMIDGRNRKMGWLVGLIGMVLGANASADTCNPGGQGVNDHDVGAENNNPGYECLFSACTAVSSTGPWYRQVECTQVYSVNELPTIISETGPVMQYTAMIGFGSTKPCVGGPAQGCGVGIDYADNLGVVNTQQTGTHYPCGSSGYEYHPAWNMCATTGYGCCNYQCEEGWLEC